MDQIFNGQSPALFFFTLKQFYQRIYININFEQGLHGRRESGPWVSCLEQADGLCFTLALG
jgi:hypothetical protein